MKMDKPLKDWTLGELQQECERRKDFMECDSCPAGKLCDSLARDGSQVYPERWKIEVEPQFTQCELAVMRALKGMVDKLHHQPEKDVVVGSRNNSWVCEFCGAMFPSIKPGGGVRLDDIDLGEKGG